MSGPFNIKIQKTGADEIGNGHGRCPPLILSVEESRMASALIFTQDRGRWSPVERLLRIALEVKRQNVLESAAPGAEALALIL